METEVFVARQPILNRGGAVVAHELLFRNARTCVADVRDGSKCSATVVERVLGAFGMDQVLDKADGFLNCTQDFLLSELMNVLPATRFVLEVLEDTDLTADLGVRCDVLRRAGFRIALDDVRTITPDVERFLKHVDIVKLDWPYISAEERLGIVACGRRAGKRMLAEKLEERADHVAASQVGCDLFQGFYFAKPQLLVTGKIPSSFAGVSRVLQLLMEDASVTRLERAMKNSPALVVQLLRLVNSSSHAHSHTARITSIRQALTFVGSRQLTQWCCLLLYGTSLDQSLESDPLLKLVERRAGFMERAARELAAGNGEFCQSAWLTGLLSLIHVPHGVDAETLIAGLPVGPTIRDAIIARSGELGCLLSIASDLEAGHFDAALDQSSKLGRTFAAKLPALSRTLV